LEKPLPVSIIVTCRNNELTIGDCLHSLVDQDYPSDSLEIIVIDACSTDRTVEIAKKYTPNIFSAPLNAAAAYNYAMRLANFGILGFVDADAKVEQKWLKKLVPHLADPKVAGVSGSIETWNPENLWARIIGYEIKTRYSRIKTYTGRIATMNLLLKRPVIEEVGGWDESLPSQYDTDFGFRMTSKGYKFAYESEAKCFHYNRTTLRAYWRQQLQYGKNTLKLYLKHSNLAKGDEITNFGMNVQPAFLFVAVATFLFGIIPQLRSLWIISGIILGVTFIYYLLSAMNISLKFRDSTALFLILLFFIRSSAWLSGAAVTTYIWLSRKEATLK
jgi:cellulose synthase/poly-beta-1,6-N-acetylglucosamine synthase-like glycosyltransferase